MDDNHLQIGGTSTSEGLMAMPALNKGLSAMEFGGKGHGREGDEER
jgi:hypothetical protein